MKNLLVLFVAAILFTGCEKIEGQLNVSKDLKLRTTKGVVRILSVGTYSADIKANTKKKITLRLNNDRDEKYEFNIPDGSIPSNGAFAFNSSVVGQPVDLSGSVATTVTQTDRRQTTESCQYQIPVQTCYPTPNGGMSCSTHYETRFGTRWIEYYDRRTEKDVVLSIAAANTNVESATFQGDIAWIDRIVLRETACR